jgi:hypothetical protein
VWDLLHPTRQHAHTVSLSVPVSSGSVWGAAVPFHACMHATTRRNVHSFTENVNSVRTQTHAPHARSTHASYALPHTRISTAANSLWSGGCPGLIDSLRRVFNVCRSSSGPRGAGLQLAPRSTRRVRHTSLYLYRMGGNGLGVTAGQTVHRRQLATTPVSRPDAAEEGTRVCPT